jgi:ABC-type uncharacterized transport system ATPase subunit
MFGPDCVNVTNKRRKNEMTKKKRVVKNLAAEPTVEAPKEQEQLFNIKLEMIGAEPVTVNGLDGQGVQRIRQWFSGLGHSIFELTVGTGLLVFDRSKVAYLVVGPQEGEQVEGIVE